MLLKITGARRCNWRWMSLLLPLVAAGCEGSAEVRDGGLDALTEAGLDGAGDVLGPPSTQYAKLDPAQLFDAVEVPTFELRVAPSDLQKMHEDASHWFELQQQGLDLPYVPADLFFKGDYVGRVGLRNKGTYGTLKLCFDGATQICPKLSFKIKFDEYDDARRFYGMKRINLHSLVRDGSMMHERLGYALFREMGVPASRAAHSRVVINGQVQGVFSMVEQVEGHFTDTAYGGDGNLYKEVWPTSGDAGYYTRGLENNKAAPDHSKMIAFYNDLAAASAGELPDVVGRWTDTDRMLRFMAVLEAIRYWDSIVAVYCGKGGGGCGNHNYYWYQDDRSDGTTRFQLIPWDLDTTWVMATVHDGVPHWYEPPVDCSKRYEVGSADSTVVAPRCDRLIDGLARLGHDAFAAKLTQLLDGPFQTATLNAKIDDWATQIAAAVAEDPHLPAGASGWRGEVVRLKREIPLLRQRIMALRDGAAIVPFGLSIAVANDFESADALGVAMALEYYSSGGTDFWSGLGTSSPLAGVADLRLDFEYRNTDTAWGQWTQLFIPFTDHATVDLSQLKEIRMKARSNATRNVRFDFRSPAHTMDSKAYRFGWDVSVGPDAKELVLPMSTIAMPTWASPVPPDKLADVARQVTGFAIHANCNNRGTTGFMPDGTTDLGFLELDDVVFVMQ